MNEAHRCAAVKNDGSRCKMPPMADSTLCRFHDPRKKEENLRNSAKGGRKRALRSPTLLALKNIEAEPRDILTIVTTCMHLVTDNRLSPSAGHAVASLGSTALKAHEIISIQKRLDELERRIEEKEIIDV